MRYLLLVIMPLLAATGQILIKQAAPSIRTGDGLFCFVKSLIHPKIAAGAAAVLAAPLLYILALEEVPLSEAFAFNSLNYIFVFIAGRVFLSERPHPLQYAAAVFIAAGLLLPYAAGGI